MARGLPPPINGQYHCSNTLWLATMFGRRGGPAYCCFICTLISSLFQSSCWLDASGRDDRPMLLMLSKHLRGISVFTIPRFLPTPHFKDCFGSLLLKLWIFVSSSPTVCRRGDITRKVATPAQDRRTSMLIKEKRG